MCLLPYLALSAPYQPEICKLPLAGGHSVAGRLRKCQMPCGGLMILQSRGSPPTRTPMTTAPVRSVQTRDVRVTPPAPRPLAGESPCYFPLRGSASAPCNTSTLPCTVVSPIVQSDWAWRSRTLNEPGATAVLRRPASSTTAVFTGPAKALQRAPDRQPGRREAHWVS